MFNRIRKSMFIALLRFPRTLTLPHSQNKTEVSLDVSNGDKVRCEVESPYDKIITETTVVVIGQSIQVSNFEFKQVSK